MGLDMYLIRKKYIGAKYEHRKVTGSVDIKIDNKKIPINFNRISYIEEDACYWRKANQIHKWFVDNVQDGEDNCKEYLVTLDTLKELLAVCKEVKEKAILKKGQIECGKKFDDDGNLVPIMGEGKYIENADEIESLLPTQEGFFFGGTGYDERYMEDIDYTIKELSKIIKDEEKLNKKNIYSDFYYCSSW